MTVEALFLTRIISALDDAGIPYMLAGSLASGVFGQSRATNDADIVIAPTHDQLDRFLASLGDYADYYVDAETARKSLRDQSMFNVIEFSTGSKADLIVLQDRSFSQDEFSRRIRADVFGTSVWVVSPEGAILSKLEWSKMGESERQFQDALGVAIMQGDNLDWAYLRKWAVELDVETLLDRLIAEVNVAKKARPS